MSVPTENTPMRHGPPFTLIIVSILGVLAWAVFILLYTLFWSSKYGLLQNLVVAVATLLIVALLIGLMWVMWGMRYGWRSYPSR